MPDRKDWQIKQPPPAEMMSPVRCTRCGTVYDLCHVKTGARYSDCTVYTTPCCGRQADDRLWKGSPDIVKLTREEAVNGGVRMTPYGLIVGDAWGGHYV